MKKFSGNFSLKTFIVTIILSCANVMVWAQDNTVKINGEDVGSWLSRNWMWVAGGVVLLLLLIGVLSGSSRSRTSTTKKTTIVREEDADGIIRTTTTEIRE